MLSMQLGTLSIYLSKLSMVESYAVHHAFVTKIRIREDSLACQAKKETRKAKENKALLR